MSGQAQGGEIPGPSMGGGWHSAEAGEVKAGTWAYVEPAASDLAAF